jgi:heptosyltransferase-3
VKNLPTSILVIRTDRIGDVVLTLPMLNALREIFPKSRLSILVRAYTQDIVSQNPSLDDVVKYNPDESVFHLARKIKSGNYDMVILAYPRFNLALAVWFAGVKIRVGTGYRWYSLLFNRKVYDHRKLSERHEAEYNIRLLKAFKPDFERHIKPSDFFIQTSDEHRKKALAIRTSLGLESSDIVIGIHLGSGGSARDWPMENFVQLITRLVAELNVKILLTGQASEKPLIENVLRQLSTETQNQTHSVAGELSIKELAELLKTLNVFIANSTGPIHIAAAVGTKTLGFYPPLLACSPKRWRPYADNSIVLCADKPDCRECVSDKTTCSCMQLIGVDAAFQAVKTLLSK